MKIALVTYQDKGNYAGEGASEDKQLEKYLKLKGLDVKYEVWNNGEVNWTAYGLVILKSPWDYFDRIEEFRNWLDHLDGLGIRVLNPTAIVRWNYDKKYLLEVEEAGFGIVPSRLIPAGGTFDPEIYYQTWATDKVLVKPAISGGAKNTFPISRAEADHFVSQVNDLLQQEAYLVQPFMPEVQNQGEWSLVFFNGRFSHCVLKVPKAGDFRVQHFFGGAIIPTTPPPVILEEATRLVQQFAAGCLYARVDGLETKGHFQLMELELIEPLLYLLDREDLYENYYKALLELVEG